MTELMKRYEAETGESFLQAIEFNKVSYYMACYKAWLEREYHILEAENAQLKDQLRWRPVSEKPKESDRYIVKYRQGKIVKKFIADYDVVYGWNIPLPDVEIIEWLPFPPAPEGE